MKYEKIFDYDEDLKVCCSKQDLENETAYHFVKDKIVDYCSDMIDTYLHMLKEGIIEGDEVLLLKIGNLTTSELVKES